MYPLKGISEQLLMMISDLFDFGRRVSRTSTMIVTTSDSLCSTYIILIILKLGKGSFGVVNEARERATGQLYAVKVFEQLEDVSNFQREAKILRLLKHENIVRFHYSNTFESFYIVTEMMHGGTLFDRIKKRKSYTEQDARDACKQIFQAVEYCHFNRVVHRDIKPENLLLASLNNDTDVKLADFGTATFVFTGDRLSTYCGTPSYMAPEIVNKEKYYGMLTLT